jgi:hypothetical protein
MPPELNSSIQQWLTFGHVTEDKINLLLSLMSPYEASAGKENLMFIIQKGEMKVMAALTMIMAEDIIPWLLYTQHWVIQKK